MSGALNKIFAEVTDFTKTMGTLHRDFLTLVQRDINHFLEITQDLTNQMNWQGWTTIALTSLNASCSIAGACFPKAADNAAAQAVNPRLGAHDGITDGFSNIMKTITQKLSDNNFLRTTCKTASKTFDGLGNASSIWFRSSETKLEGNKALIQSVNLQDGQAKKSQMDQQVQMAQQAVSRLLDSKSKGG